MFHRACALGQAGHCLNFCSTTGSIESEYLVDLARFSVSSENITVLTSEKLTCMGNAATFYSVCVEVELFRA
jgi:hypothetical protein